MYDSAQWLAKVFEYLSQKTLRIIMYVCVSVKHFEIETRYRRDHIDKISNESENLCTRYLSQIFSKKLLHSMSRYLKHVISVKNSATLL